MAQEKDVLGTQAKAAEGAGNISSTVFLRSLGLDFLIEAFIFLSLLILLGYILKTSIFSLPAFSKPGMQFTLLSMGALIFLLGIFLLYRPYRDMVYLQRQIQRFLDGNYQDKIDIYALGCVQRLAQSYIRLLVGLQEATQTREVMEGYLSKVLENTREAILFLSSDLKVFKANSRAGALLEYSPQEIAGLSFVDFLNEQDKGRYRDLFFEDPASLANSQGFRLSMLSRGGSPIPVQAFFTAVYKDKNVEILKNASPLQRGGPPELAKPDYICVLDDLRPEQRQEKEFLFLRERLAQLEGNLEAKVEERTAGLEMMLEEARHNRDMVFSILEDNEEVRSRLRASVERLRILSELELGLARIRDLAEAVHLVVKAIQDLMNVERVSILVLDEEERKLKVIGSLGIPEEFIKDVWFEVSESIVSGWVFIHNKELLIRDIVQDRRFIAHNKGGYDTNSLLSVPIRREGKPIGVINVNNKSEKGVFTEADKEILEAVAARVSIAMENAYLYQELRRHIEVVETELAQKNLSLMEANERLLALDRLKDEFIYSVTHELRTPITSIRAFSEMMVDDPTIDEKTRLHFLSTINKECVFVTRIVNDILDLSKLKSGLMEWEYKDVSLKEIVEESLSVVELMAKEAGLTLEGSVSDGLPQLRVDGTRIKQVMENLLYNAIKFTPKGGSVRVRAEKRDERFVQVSVQDTGIGIPKDEHERIFDKFYQVFFESHGKPKGTGLGLSISKGIIEHHGGKIWVESEVRKGSTFYFTLPVGKKV